MERQSGRADSKGHRKQGIQGRCSTRANGAHDHRHDRRGHPDHQGHRENELSQTGPGFRRKTNQGIVIFFVHKYTDRYNNYSSMKRKILMIVVIAAAVMELIDTSIVNVALSYMSGNLGATLEDTSWVITAYAIANVIIIPITSFLSLKLGRRNYYIGSVILFTLCSFMCGQASNIWTLVAFRFLQGMGGGALLSVSASVVYELFPREKQSVAIAVFGVGVFLGPTIGPTLGGFITDNYSWPWIFY